jgi:5-formyltetrahydrofolate cyclo-ligase
MATGDKKGGDTVNDDCAEPSSEYSSSPCYLHEFNAGFIESDGPDSRAWPAIQEWRRTQRRRLEELRQRMSPSERACADRAVLEIVDEAGILDAVDTGIYWPLQGEFDSRLLMGRVLDIGGRIAIPVIVEPDTPLEFWQWDGQAPMHALGPWDIPAPVDRHVLVPSVLIVPLLGFDVDSHRLGHGGGYFDRTLANMNPRPVTIGIGYELGRLHTIYPQGHDIPLDAIVTEKGIVWHDS